MRKPIKVCMFTNLYPPVVSGSSTHVSCLAREMARQGAVPVVITARIDQQSPEYEEKDGVVIYRLPALKLPKLAIALRFPWLSYTFTPGNIKRIRTILERHQPDVLHLHNHMFDLGFMAVKMKREFSLPLFLTVHTVIRHARWIYNLILVPLDKIFLRYSVVRHADRVISPDMNIKHYVRKTFAVTQSPVIPYGIEMAAQVGDKAASVEALRQRYGLQNQRVILSLGHVHEIRDRRDLIMAMPKILERFPDTVLLIVGGVMTNSPERLVTKLGLEKSVIFAGPIPHSDVFAHFALATMEAHWLHQPNEKNTSFGIASLEAMGAGKVVLSTASEDTYGDNILKNGLNVILVPPNDPDAVSRAICNIFADDGLRLNLERNARQVIENNFLWSQVAHKTLTLYSWHSITPISRQRNTTNPPPIFA